MIRVAKTPIGPDETAGELEDRLALLGAPLVAEAIAALEAGTAEILPQARSRVTKAPKLRKEDGLIDWTKPARDVHNLVRAMQPWPAAYTTSPAPAGRRPGRSGSSSTRRSCSSPTGLTPPGAVVEADGDRLVVAAGRGSGTAPVASRSRVRRRCRRPTSCGVTPRSCSGIRS